MVTLLVTTLQGAGKAVFACRVNVTFPAAISAAEGVYVGVRTLRLGLKVPEPPSHCVLLTVPVTLPAKVATGLIAQMVCVGPAETVGA